MKRLFLWFGIGLLLVVGAGIAVLGTENGNRWLIRTALSQLAPALSVEDIRGTLFGTLHATGVRFRDGGLSVEVDRVAIEADPFALFGNRLLVERLDAGEVMIALDNEGDGPGGAPEDYFLPLYMSTREARIARVLVQVDDTAIELEDVDIRALAGRERLSFAQIAFTVSGARVNVSGDVGLDAAMPANLDFAWRRGEAAGSGKAAGNRAQLTIEHALLGPLSLHSEGTLYLDDGVRFDALTHWDNPAGLSFDALDLSGTAQLRTIGTFDSALVSGTAALRMNDRDLALALDGVATLQALEVRSLTVHAADAVLAATGDVGWDPALNWNLQLSGEAMDPALLWPEWPGRLSLSGSLAGAQDDDGLRWELASVEVNGILRDYPLTGSGDLSGDASGAIRLVGVRAAVGDNTLALDGEFGEQVSLAFSIDATDLAAVEPDLSGHVQGEGRLEGPRVRPGISGHLTGTALSWREYAIGALQVNAELGSESSAPFRLDLTAQAVDTPLTRIGTINMTTRGTPSDHAVTITTAREQMQTSVEATGSLEDRRWTGKLKQLELLPIMGPTPGEAWRMTETASLEIAPGEILLEELCLHQAPARVCATMTFAEGQFRQLQGAVESFDLSQLQPWLGEALSLSGRYDATIAVTQDDNGPVADVAVHGGPTGVTLVRTGYQPLAGGFEALEATARLDAERATLDLTARAATDGHLRVQFDVLEPRSADAAMNGRVDADWGDLSLLSMLVPELDMGQSRLTVDSALSGTRDSPEMNATATLSGARFRYPSLGVVLEDLELTARSTGKSVLDLTGSARAGEGRLTISGETRLEEANRWPTTLHLNGAATPFIQLPDAEVSFEPDLDIAIAWPEVRVSGNTTVPSARFVLRELPAEAVRPLPETVVHDENGAAVRKPAERVRVYAELDLTLGEDVRYSALGLDGAVSGTLRLDDEPERSPQANGTLVLNGSYKFYGQELTISDGKLLFAGPLDNPTLDVKAVRKTGDVTAGVSLSGPARTPSTQLFSEPAMGESDALSYLMFGRPLNSAVDQTGSMNNAALALGVVSALPVSARAQSSLGLDELRLDSGAHDTGSIMAGKQVRPDLYIRYTYGLFNRLGGLAATYQLNDKLGVEARSAEHQSIEVTYTIKRD